MEKRTSDQSTAPKKDSLMFFSFLHRPRNSKHSKSGYGSNDSGISSTTNNGEDVRQRSSYSTNNEGVICITDDDEQDEIEKDQDLEFLCEIEFDTAQPLPMPIEQKYETVECKVEPENVLEPDTGNTENSLRSRSRGYDSLDQANLSECEDELMPLVKLEYDDNLMLGDKGGANASATFEKSSILKGNNYVLFICPQCSKQFETSDTWREHIDSVHNLSDPKTFNFKQRPNNEFECNKCQLVITRCTLKTLQQHRFTHLPYKVYKCKLCRYEARSLYLMISHIMLHKDREELGVAVRAKVGEMPQKNAVLERESQQLMAYICPACGMTFDEEDTWQAHINFRHNFLEKTAENRFEDHFKCSECNVEIFSQHVADLQQHLFSHLPFKSFLKCKLCNWTISRRNFMVSHILNLHKERLTAITNNAAAAPISNAPTDLRAFNYDIDDDESVNESIFDVSTPTATTKPTHAAAADRTANFKNSTADASLLSHNDSSAFETSSFSQKNTSITKKGYKCSGCALSFSTANQRNKHNTAEHPKYKCSLCDEKFALKVDLNRHRCATTFDVFECEICCKEFVYEKCYASHVTRCRANAIRVRKRTYPDETQKNLK